MRHLKCRCVYLIMISCAIGCQTRDDTTANAKRNSSSPQRIVEAAKQPGAQFEGVAFVNGNNEVALKLIEKVLTDGEIEYRLEGSLFCGILVQRSQLEMARTLLQNLDALRGKKIHIIQSDGSWKRL